MHVSLSLLLALAITCLHARVASAEIGARDDVPAAAPDGSADGGKLSCVTNHETAQILRREHRLLAARAALRACSGATCPGVIRADCIPWLDEVDRSLPSVVITAGARDTDLIDVRVVIDGALVTTRLTGIAFEVDPGEHHLRFESPPWPAVERTILVSEGVKGRPVDVDFAPPDAIREIRTPPGLDYILAGVALASMGTFVGFGASALHDRQQLEERCAPFCPQSDVSPVRMKLIIADVAMGVAATSLAFGLYLRAARPLPSPRRTASPPGRAVVPLVTATAEGARFGVEGQF